MTPAQVAKEDGEAARGMLRYDLSQRRRGEDGCPVRGKRLLQVGIATAQPVDAHAHRLA